MNIAVAGLVLAFAAGGPASAQPSAFTAATSSRAAQTTPLEAAPDKPALVDPAAPARGYLAASQLPDVVALIGPPPPPGSGTATGDVATFEATRLDQGDARWALAARDAVFGTDALLKDFSCALGLQLSAAEAPALRHLIDRLNVDTGAVVSVAKHHYHRPRPFVENGGPICVPADAELRHSFSYPSGHATYSWTAGLTLASLAPDRAAQVLARAKVYGESRVECGVHYESDIQAGRVAATALFTALEADPVFRRDVAAARHELDRLRAHPTEPSADQCRIEADAEAKPVW